MLKEIESRIYGEKGQLYRVKDGDRFLLADCSPEIQIWVESEYVPILGELSYQLKETRLVLALCGDMEFTQKVDRTFIRAISKFELAAGFLHKDGTTERFYFDNLVPKEIGLNGDWIFDVIADQDMIRRLRNL